MPRGNYWIYRLHPFAHPKSTHWIYRFYPVDRFYPFLKNRLDTLNPLGSLRTAPGAAEGELQATLGVADGALQATLGVTKGPRIYRLYRSCPITVHPMDLSLKSCLSLISLSQ